MKSQKGGLRPIKETHIHKQKPIYMKRDLFDGKKTYMYDKRPTAVSFEICEFGKIHNRDPYTQKEANIYKKRHTCITSDLLQSLERPTYLKKFIKEIHIHKKRPIYTKRDVHV